MYVDLITVCGLYRKAERKHYAPTRSLCLCMGMGIVYEEYGIGKQTKYITYTRQADRQTRRAGGGGGGRSQ